MYALLENFGGTLIRIKVKEHAFVSCQYVHVTRFIISF